jgi:phosphoribosylamine---glycine ligase
MKILIVGSGGREHTLAWKIAQSDLVTDVFAAPGNPGIALEPKCRVVNISAANIPELFKFAQSERIDLTVVGPEVPLCDGLTDYFAQAGLKVFGPSQKAARLEGSKVFTKELFRKYNIATADFEVFTDMTAAEKFINNYSGSMVVKADGLAAGKGVIVCKNREEALESLHGIMRHKWFGDAGDRVVIEECLEGEEASFIAFTDGEHVLPLAGSQDHKAIFDNDAGPNTGGMGAYSPAPVITPEIHDKIMNDVMIPVVKAMEKEGSYYRGFLYAGVMIKNGEPKVLEFNCRMGDPEAQPLLYRMKSDIVPLMLAAMDGTLNSAEISWEPEDAVCVVMASGGYPGSYKKGFPITGIDKADQISGVKVFHAGTGFENNNLVTAGGRVLGVTAKAPGIERAIEKAYTAVDLIQWEGAHFRKDIGKKALNRD